MKSVRRPATLLKSSWKKPSNNNLCLTMGEKNDKNESNYANSMGVY